MKAALPLFRFLIEAAARGERTALVTLTDVTGSASRAAGTHMAVSDTGASWGSFSGGCVEAAVVAEAQRVIAARRAELVRFGAGSRYIDIRLPCGGGIDLLFTPDPPIDVLREAVAALTARRQVVFALGRDGTARLLEGASPGWWGDRFVAVHRPDLRLLIVGHGAETTALARQALAFEAGVEVLSPDPAIVEAARAMGAEASRLLTPRRSPRLVADDRSAVLFLFHDHDWEPELIAQALETDAFFVGAMGSRATQARRGAVLAAHGVGPAAIARLVGPVGLIPATRDPDTLALSILAQVVGLSEAAVPSQAMPQDRAA